MKKARIFYYRVPDQPNPEAKLDVIRQASLKDLPFEAITPDSKANWINLADNDFESLIPLCDKKVKLGRSDQAIFRLFSLGVSTNRDEWVFDIDRDNLRRKARFFIDTYNRLLEKEDDSWETTIKWSEYLKGIFKRRIRFSFDETLLINACYRPFFKLNYYADRFLSDRLTQNHFDMFGNAVDQGNLLIAYTDSGSQKPFMAMVIDTLPDLHYVSPACGTNCLPLYRYDADGNRHDNITDWGLAQFRAQYADEITKIDIFHYVYAVLHNPAYRKKYELNLKREFPRIPFYDDFWQWAAWGKSLMELHLNYETIEPYPLVRTDTDNNKGLQPLVMPLSTRQAKIKVKLKADKVNGVIDIDEVTSLHGVPKIAWTYKLGNRSALEWILDQYKEKKPRDPTIREKFDTYQFADYKEQVIDLLKRVCAVSVETMKIVGEMENLDSSLRSE